MQNLSFATEALLREDTFRELNAEKGITPLSPLTVRFYYFSKRLMKTKK